MEWGTMFEFAVDCRNPVEHMGNLKKGISDILNHWGVEATQKVFLLLHKACGDQSILGLITHCSVFDGFPMSCGIIQSPHFFGRITICRVLSYVPHLNGQATSYLETNPFRASRV